MLVHCYTLSYCVNVLFLSLFLHVLYIMIAVIRCAPGTLFLPQLGAFYMLVAFRYEGGDANDCFQPSKFIPNKTIVMYIIFIICG